MKPIQVELPDRLAEELELLVKAGWFRDEEEAVRLALLEFLRRNRVALLERFQREDIEWALSSKKASSS
ncbi:MAG TPA: CopG family transcriptional regulator [Vicinamibacteria bacterium]|nr:CopG family transcriptional regulator [Vicinamibacteria bacterium]